MDKKSDGFTLIELIVVIAILGILVAVAVPRLAGFRSMAEESVCVTNRKAIERKYFVFLAESAIDHAESMFGQFVLDNFNEVCPSGGAIRYDDGMVKCNVHGGEGEGEGDEESEEEVPWL